jgi:hypothetical protein
MGERCSSFFLVHPVPRLVQMYAMLFFVLSRFLRLLMLCLLRAMNAYSVWLAMWSFTFVPVIGGLMVTIVIRVITM